MGIPVPFLEVDVPTGESWFAACLVRLGLRGDMMGRPDRQGGHRIGWIVDGLQPAEQAALQRELATRYEEVATVSYGDAWIGRGRIRGEEVASPALRAYIDVEDRFEAPWLHVDGQATLRLLPRSDMDLLVDMARLRRALLSQGAAQEPRIRSHHLDRYQALRDMLGAAVLAPASPEGGGGTQA